MALLDSPLNKSGNMQVRAPFSGCGSIVCFRALTLLLQVFVHTNKNVLFTVSPKCRIPRTFKRFAGLMGEWALLVCVALPAARSLTACRVVCLLAQCNCCIG